MTDILDRQTIPLQHVQIKNYWSGHGRSRLTGGYTYDWVTRPCTECVKHVACHDIAISLPQQHLMQEQVSLK